MNNRNLKKVNNIAFIAIIESISIIICFACKYIPFSFLGVIFILPLLSSYAVTKLNYRDILLFVLSITLLLFATNLDVITDVLFYLIPSTYLGICIGLLIKSKTPIILNILISSIFTLLLNIISNEMINSFYEINLILTLMNLFKISIDLQTFVAIPLLFIISLIQSVLTLFFIQITNKYLNFKSNLNNRYSVVYRIFILIFTILAITSMYVNILNSVFLLFVCFSLFLYLFTFYDMYKTNTKMFIFDCINFIVFVIITLIFSIYIKKPFQLVLLLGAPSVSGIINIFSYYINNNKLKCYTKRDENN